jgi:hypothetical protein
LRVLRHALVFGVAGLSLLSRDPGCGGGVDSEPSGVNAPCTRDKDCGDGLKCTDGVCTSPTPHDAGSESGAKDAAADG